MNLDWEKYRKAALMIISNIDYGVVFVTEDNNANMTGFMMFTYEWSDWRDGIFYWLQGLEGSLEATVAMKACLEKHASESNYKICGIRLCSEKAIHHENKAAVDLWGLTSSHYYIYHVDA